MGDTKNLCDVFSLSHVNLLWRKEEHFGNTNFRKTIYLKNKEVHGMPEKIRFYRLLLFFRGRHWIPLFVFAMLYCFKILIILEDKFWYLIAKRIQKRFPFIYGKVEKKVNKPLNIGIHLTFINSKYQQLKWSIKLNMKCHEHHFS